MSFIIIIITKNIFICTVIIIIRNNTTTRREKNNKKKIKICQTANSTMGLLFTPWPSLVAKSKFSVDRDSNGRRDGPYYVRGKVPGERG